MRRTNSVQAEPRFRRDIENTSRNPIVNPKIDIFLEFFAATRSPIWQAAEVPRKIEF
jgi:hypothetical protein